MKIWIIYDTKYGSNRLIAEKMQELLQANHEVKISYAKKISAKQVIDDKPDAILIGGPRRIGDLSRTIRKWAEKFAELMNKNNASLSKVAAWETHGEIKEEETKADSDFERKIIEKNLNTPLRWKETISKIPAEREVIDVLGINIVGMEESMGKGKLEPEAMQKIETFIQKFIEA